MQGQQLIFKWHLSVAQPARHRDRKALLLFCKWAFLERQYCMLRCSWAFIMTHIAPPPAVINPHLRERERSWWIACRQQSKVNMNENEMRFQKPSPSVNDKLEMQNHLRFPPRKSNHHERQANFLRPRDFLIQTVGGSIQLNVVSNLWSAHGHFFGRISCCRQVHKWPFVCKCFDMTRKWLTTDQDDGALVFLCFDYVIWP